MTSNAPMTAAASPLDMTDLGPQPVCACGCRLEAPMRKDGRAWRKYATDKCSVRAAVLRRRLKGETVVRKLKHEAVRPPTLYNQEGMAVFLITKCENILAVLSEAILDPEKIKAAPLRDLTASFKKVFEVLQLLQSLPTKIVSIAAKKGLHDLGEAIRLEMEIRGVKAKMIDAEFTELPPDDEHDGEAA